MSENNVYDLIIIGGGPAGLAAGLYAMRAAMTTVLVERGAFGGQLALTKEVENYLGFQKITGLDLSERFLQHARDYNLEVVQNEVVAVETGPDFHSAILEDGRVLWGHAIILGTGGLPRRLDVRGERRYSGRGVSYCAKCDGLFFKDQRVVVVGGGDTAVEEAIYLAKLASEVHIIDIESDLRSSKILQQRLMSACNVRIHSNTTLSEIKGDGRSVTEVTLRNVRTGERGKLAAEGVFVFIGLSPNNTLVPKGVQLTQDGYVVTNEKRETNVPGIYVVGDLRRKYANQLVIAVADGCIGALAAAQYVEMKKELNKSCDYTSMRPAA